MTNNVPQFSVHQFEFTAKVQTPLALPAWPGSAIRGALLSALRNHYCAAPDDPDPAHSMVCPVCWLMAREDPGWRWGRMPARPYAIALDGEEHARPRLFQPGESFSFRVTLFGKAINLFPYLVLAVPEMGRMGVGKLVGVRASRGAREQGGRGAGEHGSRDGFSPAPQRPSTSAQPAPRHLGSGAPPHLRSSAPPHKRRGRFVLQCINAVHPLSGARQTVLAPGSTTVEVPTLAVDESQVREASERLLEELVARGNRLRVRFVSPTRIVHQKRLLKVPEFRPLFGRALDRVEALVAQYGEAHEKVPGMLVADWDARELLVKADAVRLVGHKVAWVELKSGSRRTGRTTPTGGFTGWAVYETDDWRPFLPVLVWGTVVQVGKDVVKGDGVMRICE